VRPRATSAIGPPIVRGVDHFFATSPHPEPLYRFFRDTLGLPEVYPFRDYGEFASGVVSVGNVLFEVVTWKVPAGERLPTEFKGIALEPSARLAATMAQLAAYGVDYQKPDSVLTTDSTGTRATAYVNIPLDGPAGLPPVGASVFINDNLGRSRPAERRRAGAEELERRAGGALGATAVVELVIGVDDPDAAAARWRRLLGDRQQESANVVTWPVGPALRFVRASPEGIREMVMRVRSLERARHFLEARRMLVAEDGRVLIKPDAVDGLRIRLVE
jgi:catechol 2,3-dioxygenase-like lactoylglutathione lyase family enzyme